MVDDAGHCHGGIEVEFVDGNDDTHLPRWRESGVGEYCPADLRLPGRSRLLRRTDPITIRLG
jgi:hypothetical protein